MGSILIYTLPITFLLLSTVGVLQSLDVKDIYDSIKDIDSSSFDGVTPHMSRRLRAISANSKLTASKWLSGRPSKWLCESAPTTLTENLPVIVVNQTRSRALRGATRRFQRTKKEALVGRDVSEGDSGNLGKDYLKLLPRLLLDISAYVQVSDITIITPGLNQDLCQALAIKILREGRFGRCLSFEDLEGYVDVLVLLSEDEASDGDGVSRLLRAVISKEDDGKLEAGHVVVVLGHLGEVSAPRTSVTQYLVVKFQENHTFEFTEYFTFGNSRPASSVVGFWTREKPWISVRGDIVAPHDFEGNVIRAAITHSEPYIIIRKNDRGRTLSVEGYLVDLWRVLEDELNFTTQWLVPQDEEFGTPLPNGSWSGMVGLLKNGRADVALGPLSVTIPRSYVMDFSPAIDYHVLRLLILRGTSHDALDWGTYILAFHWLIQFYVMNFFVQGAGKERCLTKEICFLAVGRGPLL
ncbi:uncharacterized protein LOC143036000 [Oratosquilla oratoria]|uniref:uncharacterized protein LOC143036000 n=1 Tax=Oratosquilla oratoria TaxID=337810 RepID=UPI003F75C515